MVLDTTTGLESVILPIIHTLILASVLLKPNLKLTHTYIRTALLVTIMEWAILEFIIIPTALTMGMESVLQMLNLNLLLHMVPMATDCIMVLDILVSTIHTQPPTMASALLNLNLLLHMVPMATDCIMVLDILVST